VAREVSVGPAGVEPAFFRALVEPIFTTGLARWKVAGLEDFEDVSRNQALVVSQLHYAENRLMKVLVMKIVIIKT